MRTDGRIEGQTDRQTHYKPVVAFRNFAKAPKKDAGANVKKIVELWQYRYVFPDTPNTHKSGTLILRVHTLVPAAFLLL